LYFDGKIIITEDLEVARGSGKEAIKILI